MGYVLNQKKRPGIMRLSVVVIALVVAVAVGTEGRRLHSKRVTAEELTPEQEYTELRGGFFATMATELFTAADNAKVSTIEGLCNLVSSGAYTVTEAEQYVWGLIESAYSEYCA